MLTKILYLLLVITGVVLLIRRKLHSRGEGRGPAVVKQAPFEVRMTAWLTVILMVGSSLVMLLWD